jgi:hypothetical protein
MIPGLFPLQASDSQRRRQQTADKESSRNNFPFSVARDSAESAWLGILHKETVIVFGSMSWSKEVCSFY